MIDHRRAVDLAATAIDFVLEPRDRQALDEHLGACAACRAEAIAMRGDASAMAVLPPIAPPTWIRRAVGRRHGPRRAFLLIAAALVLAATVGVALAVGAVLRLEVAPDASRSAPPRPTLVSVAPSPSTVASPSVTPSQGPLPVSKPTSFPAGSGSAWIGPGPDRGVWILADHSGGVGADATSVTVLGLVDAAGHPRPGWPITLTGWRCADDGPPHGLPVAADGSIRLVCVEDTTADGPQRHVGFAFDSAGRALPGWPVELPDVGLTQSAVVVGNELRLVASEIASTDGSATKAQAAAWWVVSVAATGEVRVGRRYEVADAAGSFDVRLAADGVAYRLAFSGGPGTEQTEISAFDTDGLRPGWPVVVDGTTSHPAVGPDGRLVFVRLMKGSSVTAQTMSIAPAGGQAVVTSGDLPLDPLDDRTGAGPVLLAPIVAGDGALFVVGTFDSTHPAVVRVVPGSSVSPRMLLAMPLQPQGVCNAQDTGCGVWRVLPTVGSDGTLYVPENAVGDGGGLAASAGGSLVAISPDGTAPTGWPIFLADPMAGYWSLLARDDGTLDALAVVTTDAGNQWTLVILDQNGATRSSTPIIRP